MQRKLVKNDIEMNGHALSTAIQFAETDLPPSVALVMPCYGYASFLPEFLEGILAQRGNVAFRCILVDDGDPDPMMRETAQTYAAAYPEFIHYLRARNNGGLSSARNAGVEYAMELWPSVRMVMFPDGDDRVSRDYVQNSFDAFLAAEAATQARGRKLGWVFEHPVMFGIPGDMPRITQHSVLWNLIGATQMPSSALSIQMFREGLRYNEELKWAGEDWAFSVSALSAGFVAEYCDRQGFLWRRRPGSMSAAHGATMARQHNATVIRLNNKPLFSYADVTQAQERENPHYCLATAEGLFLAASPRALSPASGSDDIPISFDALARKLNANQQMPADPCPQTFLFAPGGLPQSLMSGALRDYFTLVSDFYAGQGIAVCHRFHEVSDPESEPGLFDASHGRPHHSDVVAMSLEQVQKLLLHPALDEMKFLTMDWRLPRAGKAPQKKAGALLHATDVIRQLGTCGYDLDTARRAGRQKWKPNNLTWRSLPGFLLGTQGVFPGGGDKTARLIVCGHADLPDILDRLAQANARADIMTLDSGTPEETRRLTEAETAGIVSQHYPAGSALASTGPSRAFWMIDPMTRVLQSYGTVTFWRTMRFADKLATLKTNGALREIIFADADDVEKVLTSISSAFKCYDIYRVLDEHDDRAQALLNAYGIADEATQFGFSHATASA